MVALILAPETFSRNKFFGFYEQGKIWRARRRAQMVRSLIKDLTEPSTTAMVSGRGQAIIEQDRVVDGDLHLQFAVPDLGYRRSARLSKIEAAALRYCLHRAGRAPLDEVDRVTVEAVLGQLVPQLKLSSWSEREGTDAIAGDAPPRDEETP